MNLDDVALGIVEEDLVQPSLPTFRSQSRGSFLFEAALECLNVVGSKTEVAAVERVDEVLHAKPEVDVPSGEVEFDCPIGDEVDVSAIAVGGIDTGVLDRAEIEDGAIEIR